MREQRKGFPISPMCDQATCNIPASQIGFINFVVKPTVSLLVRVLPDLQEAEDLCTKNLEIWTREKEVEDAAKQAEAEKAAAAKQA